MKTENTVVLSLALLNGVVKNLIFFVFIIESLK